jgi:hypothetical protein
MGQTECGNCGQLGESKRLTAAGSPALPFRWVRGPDGTPLCPDCKPKTETRNYAYDCKPPQGESLALADGQMRLAHRYHNALIALERERRSRTDAAVARLRPVVASAEASADALAAALTAARDVIRAGNTRAGVKTRGTAEQRAEATRLRRELAAARAARKAARDEAFADPAVRRELAAVESWHAAGLKRLYNEEFAELFWGTRCHELAKAGGMRTGPPPEFARFRGGGHLCVQLQGGVPCEEFSAGRGTAARVEVVGGNPKRPWADARLRVGTAGGGPVWLAVRFRLHRPLPAGGRVKWAHLVRRREGVRDLWRLVFAVEAAPGLFAKPDRAESGRVGIDVGWRRMPDGGLRVCYWAGSDGGRADLCLPPDHVACWRKSEAIGSYRRKLFNNAHARLLAWTSEDPLPAEWTTRSGGNPHPPAAGLALWKSEERLRRLAEFWRDHRFPGDEAVFGTPTRPTPPPAAVKAAAEAGTLWDWRLYDRHLAEYQAGLRRRCRNRRDDLFRNFAADLRVWYHTAVVEKVNWRDDVLRKPQAEFDADLDAARAYHRMAAPGRLLEILKESMAGWEECDPAFTTKDCHACGGRCDFDAAAELRHACEHCGSEWDQDENAARNILAGSGLCVPG